MSAGPVYIEIKLQMTWDEFCTNEPTFCLELVDIVRQDGQQESFTADQIRMLEESRKTCALRSAGQEVVFEEEEEIAVQLYLVNKTHHYDVMLTYVCASVIKQGFELRETSMFKNKLIKVQLHELSEQEAVGPKSGSVTEEGGNNGDDDSFMKAPGVTIVISIAAVGGICCAALLVIQIVLRRRYRDGVRTYNRTYSVTSVDSIALNNVTKSRPNSGIFNPALDLAPERRMREELRHPLNFTELANFALDTEGIYQEFQAIPNKTPRLSVVPCGAEDKNRFANILPIPDTRVRLERRAGDDVSTYINANYVSGYSGQAHTYIATQAPLDCTVGDLWTMVWQEGSTAIIMLINLCEDGHKKCATYFPDSAGPESAVVCGDFSVTMTKRDVHQEYITSWLQVKMMKTGECRSVRHFWLTCWPLAGRPEPISLVRFVLDSRPQYEDSGAPVVVHCGNGTARTGTFIALDICMRQYEGRRTVDVMRCVNAMRQERAGCVQTSEQYALIYQALYEYATILSSPVISAASSAATLQAMLP